MPLITAPVTTPPDTGEPPGGTPAPLPDVGSATASYTDPSGTVWPLTDPASGWFTLSDGVSGLGAAPMEFTSDPHPRGGERLRHAQPQPRSIVWPLHVYASTHMEFVARWRALATAFTRTLREGPGVLEVARPDGTRRRIAVYYRDGFEGQTNYGDSTDDTAIVTLWCEDPYWVDVNAVAVHREQGAGVDFLVPYPSVSSSQVLGATVVNNPGDVEVWPTWVVTGPASAITFADAGTGETFTLDPNASAIGHGNLLVGEQVTIRTDPVQVRFQNGDNWVGGLNWPAATLWSLAPGDNDVTFTLSGAGPGSAVDLSFNPRYETA